MALIAVQGVTPKVGPLGGTVVRIQCAGPVAELRQVMFGDSPSIHFEVFQPDAEPLSPGVDFILSATAPPAAAGRVRVTTTTTQGPGDAAQFTYVKEPIANNTEPKPLPFSGGPFTIKGLGLEQATAVQFRVTQGATTLFDGRLTPTGTPTNTALTVTAPAVQPGAATGVTATYTVESPGGTSNEMQFLYARRPTVEKLTPSLLPLGGGQVTITGTRLTGAKVRFGNNEATPTTSSDGSLVVNAPGVATAGSVDVVVAISGTASEGHDGTSIKTPSARLSYLPVPTVTKVEPSNGPLTSPQPVTITGTGLRHATAVRFGTAAPVTPTVISDSSLTVTPPTAAAGSVNVIVSTQGGDSPLGPAARYTYLPVLAAPKVVPAAVPLTGKSVQITGTGLRDASGVRFGNGAPVTPTVNADGSLTVIAPPVAIAGPADVVVITPGGPSSATSFTYLPAPTVTKVDPLVLPPSGDRIVITGTGLKGSTVQFGTGTPVTPTVAADGNSLTVVAPAGTPPTTVEVTVTTLGGTCPTAARVSYVPLPSITKVEPPNGPLVSQSVTITGTGLTHATAVHFGETPAVIPETALTVAAPRAAAGIVDVSVATPAGTSTAGAAAKYGYRDAPTVTTVAPRVHPLGGGQVVITGTGLTDAAVRFGGRLATFVSITTGAVDTLTVIAPAAPRADTVDVTVTTPGGTGTAGSANRLRYLPPPTITKIKPPSGPLGGRQVEILGRDLLHTTRVEFGGKPTGVIGTPADDTIVVDAPSQLETTTVSVTVTTLGGVATDSFAYLPAPTITRLTPDAGPLIGGGLVKITGTDLRHVETVNFGNRPISVTGNPDGIEVTAPMGQAGPVQVTVSGPGGTSPAKDYIYDPVPKITALERPDGPFAGAPGGPFDEADVVIKGTNLERTSTVLFGSGGEATIIGVPAADRVTVRTRALAQSPNTKTVDVTLITPGGTSATTPAAQYTFFPRPVVDQLDPSTQAATLTIDIKGKHLQHVTLVRFGTDSDVVPEHHDDQLLTVTVPSGSEPVDVIAISLGGQSSGKRFTYLT